MSYWVHKITEVKGQYRVTLPKDLVESLGWKKGDVLAISKYGNDIVIVELERKVVGVEGDISRRKGRVD